MGRKTKIAIAVTSAAGLVIAFLWTFHRWSALDRWPQVADPNLFVFTQPKTEDLIGSYALTGQTITSNGLALLQGRQCQLDLRPDGSFSVTNYPSLSSSDSHPATFISGTGHWRCGALRMPYCGQDCWGLVFSSTNVGIEELALRSHGAPYDLMLTHGDPDEGAYLLFTKRK
jgi:hypothetical protein